MDWRVAPASTRTVWLGTSTSSTSPMVWVASRMPPRMASAPPSIPVMPPTGVMGTPWRRATRTTSTTSSVLIGSTTTSGTTSSPGPMGEKSEE